jgi:hypothetical protein
MSVRENSGFPKRRALITGALSRQTLLDELIRSSFASATRRAIRLLRLHRFLSHQRLSVASL